MRSKDYRELQLSSSQLVFIFTAILILGIVIFLLGVSVGKKKAQIVKTAQISSEQMKEQVKESETPSAQKPKDSINKELASHEKKKEETRKPSSPTEKKGLYYVQVGAFNNKKSAQSFAETYKKKGYTTHILDPYPSDKRPVYRVRLGGYDTQEYAAKIKAVLVKPGTRKRDQPIIIKY